MSTLVAYFSTLEAAGQAVVNLKRCADVSLLELMDRTTLRAVEDFAHLELETEAAALLIAQTETSDEHKLQEMTRACRSAGAAEAYLTQDEAEGQLLINARRQAYPALERLGSVLIDDIAVPLPALPEMFRRIEQIAARFSTLVATVAHAGDGNVHPLVVFERGNSDAEARARAAFEAIMEQALMLGGTITGEHGVGLLEMGFLERQIGARALEIQRGSQRQFDPLAILNPGKVFHARG